MASLAPPLPPSLVWKKTHDLKFSFFLSRLLTIIDSLLTSFRVLQCYGLSHIILQYSYTLALLCHYLLILRIVSENEVVQNTGSTYAFEF